MLCLQAVEKSIDVSCSRVQRRLFAVYALFRLLFDGPTNLDKLDETTHPPPRVRGFIALGTAHETFTKDGDQRMLALLSSGLLVL